MSNPEKEMMDALNGIVKWSQKREIPPGEWTIPLQDILQNKDGFTLGLKQFLFPLAIFDRHGKIELANNKMLEGTGLTDDDIKTGKVNICNIENFDFLEAVEQTRRGETSVVNDLENPLQSIALNESDDTPDYKSAILFPIFSYEAPKRGVVVFLPFDYRPDIV